MPTTPSQMADDTWFKSSYSGGNTTECVECAMTTAGTLVRDSKQTDGFVLAIGAGAWRTFVRSVTTSGCSSKT